MSASFAYRTEGLATSWSRSANT